MTYVYFEYNYTEKLLMLATIGLRVAAVDTSILALTHSGGMIVLCCVNMYDKTWLD